ncbi:MAG: HAMP domain-containing histidine kinase [Actinomycetales bacterium]|nr:HAMP domain-containing histidine kinase [Actinomycetales bacterium]
MAAVRFPVRLFASYVLVVAVGAVTAYLTVRLLAPPLYEHRLGGMDGTGPGTGQGHPMGQGPGQGRMLRGTFVSALNTALLIAIAASTAVAALVAAVTTRRLVSPLDAVRRATRRIAAGEYAVRVEQPGEPELAALAADVNTLARVLGETEARRTRLLGEVAHEMRTPLTALDGYVEGIIDGVFEASPETLGTIGDELRRLHRLADDLSELSRAEEHRLDLHPVDADLSALAERAVSRLAPQFDDAGVALRVEVPGPVLVRLDPDRVVQILTNLLGNALVATPAGGSVTVRVGTGGGEAGVEVSDTGVGLATGEEERIFDRFHRAPGAIRRSEGSGIGLTIARGIARAHGGDVTAASPGPGRGATFRLTLPIRGTGS